MTYIEEDMDIAANQRITPILELLKDGIVVATSGTGYQRHASGHHTSSNTIAYVDHNPASGSVYSLRAQQGADSGEIATIDSGHFDLVAVKKVTVIQTLMASTPPPTTPPPTGPASLTSSGTPTTFTTTATPDNNFSNVQLNDNNMFSWSFQFNGPNPAVTNNYEILLDDLPYQISGFTLGDHTVVEQDNGDGTFDYLFTSTSAIGGNNGFRQIMASSITSTGSGAAGCGCISFFLL